MEAAYRDADCRTLLLRAGDFLDTRASGNWFDRVMAAKLAKGIFTYPGDPDIAHAWAYLPDMARAAVQLAEQRQDLPAFCEVPFAGYTLTGTEMAGQIAALAGRDIRLRRLNWTPLRLAQAVMPSLRGLSEMRYLWDTPHALDGARMAALLPEFRATPVRDALRAAIAHTGAASAAGEVDPDQAVALGG
jgi:nucleoside-diphosphate-sugar epimerase